MVQHHQGFVLPALQLPSPQHDELQLQGRENKRAVALPMPSEAPVINTVGTIV